MSAGLIIVEVCDANPACTDDLFALERDYSGVSVLENMCMSQCDLCAAKPYVFLNGELLAAESVPKLLELVRAQIERTLAYYETDS
jgi:uncharacterized protein YuzB (UPF0349 family)